MVFVGALVGHRRRERLVRRQPTEHLVELVRLPILQERFQAVRFHTLLCTVVAAEEQTLPPDITERRFLNEGLEKSKQICSEI
jgi:hypothetical protein